VHPKLLQELDRNLDQKITLRHRDTSLRSVNGIALNNQRIAGRLVERGAGAVAAMGRNRVQFHGCGRVLLDRRPRQ
jgi:hypothetical protein